MPQEFKQFQQIDKNWTKMMRHSYETRNVLEVHQLEYIVDTLQLELTVVYVVFAKCCLGGDIPKGVLLDSLAAGLELCRQSLGGYLDAKRNVSMDFWHVPLMYSVFYTYILILC